MAPGTAVERRDPIEIEPQGLRTDIGTQMAAVGGKPGIEFLLLLLPERAFGRPDRPGGRPGVDVSPISRTCAHAFFHSLRPPAPASLDRKSTRLNSSH